MTGTDLEHLLGAARRAAHAGGDVVRRYFGDVSDVRSKGAGDWVSEADLGSEDEVRAVLAQEAPGVAFFGEETGGDETDFGWYVDPLDGTANFLHGLEAVGVSIALVRDGRPLVGVVHAPLLDRTYWAVAGGGAFRDDEPIRVSQRRADEAICATGFPFRHKDEVGQRYLRSFSAAFDTFEDMRRVGAASLDLCWVAEGVFDGYFELSLGTWDVAAGGLIVVEAGGVVTDWAGDDRRWLRSGDILAAPPQVHEVLRERVAQPAKGTGRESRS